MKYKITILLYIALLGFIPLLWFRDGYIITGTDINFSPFPLERLYERFFSWNWLLFAGAERSTNIASLPYAGTPGIISLFVKNIMLIEKITYVFWFMLSGFSISYLL